MVQDRESEEGALFFPGVAKFESSEASLFT